jgi:nicotinamidase-related amidase
MSVHVDTPQAAAPLLIVVDMQPGFDEPQFGARNNPSCELRVADMLRAWRRKGFAVFFTRHLSSRAGSPLCANDPRSRIKPEVQPLDGEPVFDKRTYSAFKARHFAEAVARLAPSVIVLTGIATDICVTATAREAIDLGYPVAIANDASATFERASRKGANCSADDAHFAALAALGVSGAHIASAGALVADLCP